MLDVPPVPICETTEPLLSFATQFYFLYSGLTRVSVVVTDAAAGTSAMIKTFTIQVLPTYCQQNAVATFTCFTEPTEEQTLARKFSFTCTNSADACPVGLVHNDRCRQDESYCWGYRLYKPWCNSALAPDLECACTRSLCVTGQCYSDSAFCPAPPLCPQGYTLCSDYRCVEDAAFCPSILACPTGTVLCGDLHRCGLSEKECEFVAVVKCPFYAPLLCADGFSCVSRYDLCPSAPLCPAGTVRCENGVCRKSADECFVRLPCPADRPVRCSDGSCSPLSPITCPSSLVCPPGFVATTDHRCISPTAQGAAFLTSSGQCPSTHVTCADGTCAVSFALCSTPFQCPPGFVLCSDMSCRADERQCISYKERCIPPMIRCPSRECVQRPEDCSKQIICPRSKPVRCGDGSCASNITECIVDRNKDFFFFSAALGRIEVKHPHETVDLEAGEAFPLALTVEDPPCSNAFSTFCSSMSMCVSSASNCPHQPFCPTVRPYRCPDGRCVADETWCAEENEVCEKGYVKCPLGGSCQKSLSLCPMLKSCGPYESLCSNSVCVSQLGSIVGLPSYLTESTIVGDLEYLFLTDATVFSFMEASLQYEINLCVFEIVNGDAVRSRCCRTVCDDACLEAERATARTLCRERRNHFPCEEEESGDAGCARDERRCFDNRCVKRNETCGSVTVCTRDRPVRCMNNECVHDASECEKEVTCVRGFVMCDDGSCAPNYAACSSIVCARDTPILCWDQSCRKTAEDCPTMNKCEEGMSFCAVTGSCVYDRNTCLTNELRVDDSNRHLLDFCHGKYLCPDGSCRSNVMSCPAEQCPVQYTHRCANGLCVGVPEECETGDAIAAQLSGPCPEKAPFACFDGTCVANYALCPVSMHCDPPYHRCANGLCVLSRVLCPIMFPTFFTAAQYTRHHPLLQFLRPELVLPFLNQLVDVQPRRCPLHHPFLCASGECMSSPNFCHSITPCSHSLLRNGNERCPDRSCAYDASACSNATACPAGAPVMCMEGSFSGMCVRDALDCIQENGCPLRFPKRCLNGACIAQNTVCPRVSVSNGCPADRPVKCITGECKAAETECTLLNGCSPLLPFKAANGNCYKSPKDYAAASTSCPANTPVRCWDGECVAFPAYCRKHVVCSLDAPVMCASGECGTLPLQYPTRDFIAASMLETVMVDEAELERVRNDVCRPTPVCPREIPYMCADMHCVSDYNACRSCLNCTRTNRELPFCPAPRPVYCPRSGACVKNQGDCENYRTCPPEKSYRCFTGECAATPSACVYASREQMDNVLLSVRKETVQPVGTVWMSQRVKVEKTSQTSQTTERTRLSWAWRMQTSVRTRVAPLPFTMCSNGAMQAVEACGIIPQCSMYTPKRCWNGQCVALGEECPSLMNENMPSFDVLLPLRHYLFPHRTADSLYGVECLVGQLCGDGVCRTHCALSIGCGVDEVQCPDGRCVSMLPGVDDKEVCLGFDNCREDEYRCFTGKCVRALSDCYEDHYSAVLAEEALLMVAAQEMKDVMLYNYKHEVYAYLASSSDAYLAPPEPFFLHVTSVSMDALSRQFVVIEDPHRAAELRLTPVVKPSTMLLSPAVRVEFISLRDNHTIAALHRPILFSFLKPSLYAILPLVRYDNRLYRNPLHIRDDELCPAVLRMSTWTCLNSDEYEYRAGVFYIKIARPMSIALMIHPLAPVGPVPEQTQTVGAVFVEFLCVSLYVAVPVLLVLLALLVHMMEYRLQWEQNIDCYRHSRIHTDAEAIILKEKSHTRKWRQIDFSDVVKNKQGAVSNPLAVHRILDDMYNHQLDEVRETAKKNKETIRRLMLEKEAVLVGMEARDDA